MELYDDFCLIWGDGLPGARRQASRKWRKEGETSKTSLTPGIFILYSSTFEPAAGLLGETLRTSPFLTFQEPLGFSASSSTPSFSPSVSSRAFVLPFSKFSINRGFRRDVSPPGSHYSSLAASIFRESQRYNRDSSSNNAIRHFCSPDSRGLVYVTEERENCQGDLNSLQRNASRCRWSRVNTLQDIYISI